MVPIWWWINHVSTLWTLTMMGKLDSSPSPCSMSPCYFLYLLLLCCSHFCSLFVNITVLCRLLEAKTLFAPGFGKCLTWYSTWMDPSVTLFSYWASCLLQSLPINWKNSSLVLILSWEDDLEQNFIKTDKFILTKIPFSFYYKYCLWLKD